MNSQPAFWALLWLLGVAKLANVVGQKLDQLAPQPDGEWGAGESDEPTYDEYELYAEAYSTGEIPDDLGLGDPVEYEDDYSLLPDPATEPLGGLAGECAGKRNGTPLNETEACALRISGADKLAPLLPGGLDGLYAPVMCNDGRPAYLRQGSPEQEARLLYWSNKFKDWDLGNGTAPVEDELLLLYSAGPQGAAPEGSGQWRIRGEFLTNNTSVEQFVDAPNLMVACAGDAAEPGGGSWQQQDEEQEQPEGEPDSSTSSLGSDAAAGDMMEAPAGGGSGSGSSGGRDEDGGNAGSGGQEQPGATATDEAAGAGGAAGDGGDLAGADEGAEGIRWQGDDSGAAWGGGGGSSSSSSSSKDGGAEEESGDGGTGGGDYEEGFYGSDYGDESARYDLGSAGSGVLPEWGGAVAAEAAAAAARDLKGPLLSAEEMERQYSAVYRRAAQARSKQGGGSGNSVLIGVFLLAAVGLGVGVPLASAQGQRAKSGGGSGTGDESVYIALSQAIRGRRRAKQ